MTNKEILKDIIDSIMFDDGVIIQEEQIRLKTLFINFRKFVSEQTDLESCYEQFMETDNFPTY